MGTILRIQRMSTEDGPGIRSTVFFKGCPLNCIWCHNPESIDSRRQIHWEKVKCIGCRSCIVACPKDALTAGDSGISIDRSLCDACGDCARACPSTAMDIYGASVEAHDLVREALKDKAYMQQSSGGVTLSGGEPTLQPRFAAKALALLREAGVHTALDTCGLCSWETLEMMLPHVNLILYDLKEIDPEKHRKFTGASNRMILENAVRIALNIKDGGWPGELWMRTPLIPGLTATEENIMGIGSFIHDNLEEAVVRWELCAFNNFCTHKYEGLGIDWVLKNEPLIASEEAGMMAAAARRSGVHPEKILVSGPLRSDDAERTTAGERDAGGVKSVAC